MSSSSAQALQLGMEHHRAGRLVEAVAMYREVLASEPDNAEALHLSAVVTHQMGDHAAALELIQRAITVEPLRAAHRIQQAYELISLNRFEEAAKAAGKAVELSPESALGQYALGRALAGMRRREQAVIHFRQAAQIHPDFVDAWDHLATAQKDLGNLEEAATAYRQILRLRPNAAPVLNNLGNVLNDQKKYQEAVEAYKQAIQLRPDVALVHYNLGLALTNLRRTDEAEAALREAVRLRPEYVEALCSLGCVLMGRKKVQDAIEVFKKAIEFRPDSADAHWNLGWASLLSGDYQTGWIESEWRWQTVLYHGVRRPLQRPQWNGDDLRGRWILLYSEGGLGDTVHFARYVPLVAQRGGNIILECQAALVPLLRQLKGVEHIVASGDPLPPFDVHCPLMSLPLNFKTTLQTIPATMPYLTAHSQRAAAWAQKLPADPDRPRVGLVWSGNPANENNRSRSLHLEELAPLAAAKRFRFYSLQVGTAGQEASRPPPGMEIFDYTAELHDFADTAAMVANLDLVISVDTSVAHLAGAMAKPVWTLVPHVPDWRWMLQGELTPWYPTMRLFRRESREDWNETILRVTKALLELRKSP